jgi:hypothetical protein
MSLYLFINLLYSIPGDESGYSPLSSPNVGIFPAKKRLISKKSSYILGRAYCRVPQAIMQPAIKFKQIPFKL